MTKQGSEMLLQLDYIRARLISTSTWREQLTARYPNDKRNAIASDLLRALAEGTDEDISAATKAALAQVHGPAFVKACQDSCREVLFRYLPQTLEDVATNVIARMETPANAEAGQ
jgi:hypothetical protein